MFANKRFSRNVLNIGLVRNVYVTLIPVYGIFSVSCTKFKV